MAMMVKAGWDDGWPTGMNVVGLNQLSHVLVDGTHLSVLFLRLAAWVGGFGGQGFQGGMSQS